jgi:protein-arginine deiminase
MRRMKLAVVALPLLCVAPGCKDDSGGDDSSSGTDSGTLDTSTGEDGTGDSTTGAPQGWEFSDIYGVPNLDDDDANDKSDWLDALFDGDDDMASFVLRADAVASLGEGESVRLTLGGSADQVRLWMGSTPVLGHGTGDPVLTYEFSPEGETAFPLEFANYLSEATLTIDRIDSGGSVLESAEIRLLASPLILNHHLQPTEAVFATDLGSNNAGLISGYAQTLGDFFNPIPGNVVQNDPWMQDETQFATSMGMNGERMNTVIDSIRDRGLDNFAPTYLDIPDWYRGVWGVPSQVTSWDSFGNLECSPPVTVDGVEYPFGRIYYGKWGTQGIHQDVADLLEGQKIQDPFDIDTSWLCVGHVDEFTSFVPDPSSEKGFKMLIGDVDAAWELLNGLDPSFGIGKYQSGHGFGTVGAILNDANIVAENNDLQADVIDVEREKFKAALGLTEEDIIRIPSLFEVVSQCGGDVAALIPGTPNLIVGNPDNGSNPVLFPPDPWFRGSTAPQSEDPVIADFINRMPDGVDVQFLDDWNTYHLGLGEVHCGTNVIRTPIANWWEVALHLL